MRIARIHQLPKFNAKEGIMRDRCLNFAVQPTYRQRGREGRREGGRQSVPHPDWCLTFLASRASLAIPSQTVFDVTRAAVARSSLHNTGKAGRGAVRLILKARLRS